MQAHVIPHPEACMLAKNARRAAGFPHVADRAHDRFSSMANRLSKFSR
jgi:hypothetical protein